MKRTDCRPDQGCDPRVGWQDHHSCQSLECPGVHEEHRKRQIVVELEQRQVHAVGFDQSNTDELIHEVTDPRVATNNLLVKLAAVPSRDASENDHQRLVGPASNRLCSLVVKLPTIIAGGAVLGWVCILAYLLMKNWKA